MPSPFSYKELITLLNQIPDPMFITEAKKDGFLHIIEANDAAVEHMKYTKDELLTMSPFDLVESDFLKKATINHTELKRGKVLELESIHVTKEGKNVPVNLKLKQVNFTDKNPYVITLFNDISDKHHTEALLKNTHQQLEALFDYNPDLIFMMDNEGYFINTNPANYRILKYTKEEMLLKNFSDVVYPDDMELTNEHFQLVLNKQSVQVELRVLDKQQNILILDVTAVPIITKDKVAGIIGIARDISEEKRMSNALQESEQRYRSIYENNIDAVLSFDLNGRFSYMNKATEELMGYTADELIGTPFLPHIVPEERERTAEEYAKVKSGNAVQYETCMFNKQQERVHLHVTVIPIIVDGEVTGIHCLGKDITDKKKFEEKLNYMAYHDYLTALPNQHHFHYLLKKLLSNNTSAEFAIFFLDLDRFKIVNDSLGHEYGDVLLKKVAQRIQSNKPSTSTAFRYGGDEFILLLEQTTEAKSKAIAEKLLKSLSLPYDLEGIDLVATPSIGISIYPHDGQDAKTLIKKADNAMYHAKRNGKNNFQFYCDSMHSKIQGNVEMESLLRKAITNKEFILLYQPQINANSKTIRGVEALIRWNNKELGMISPAEFIPLAEESGLIVPIGEWVLKEACQQIKAWHQQGLPKFPVSVNLSIRQFYQHDLVPTIQQILEEADVDPKYLELEITESMAMDADSASTILNELKKLGVCIAIDDFGTGYSSLSYLKKFPIDHLKIDQSFVKDISVDVDDRDIISTIIMLAHNLDIVTIAEGVETEEHITFLKKHGCDVLQGYHFSKPLPPKDFEKWYSNWNFK